MTAEVASSADIAIYVGNLSYETTEDTLREAFGSFGEVSRISLPVDRMSGRPRGFGFVHMSNQTAADDAIRALDGTEIDGRTLHVNISRGPRAGGDRGGDRGDRRGGDFGGRRGGGYGGDRGYGRGGDRSYGGDRGGDRGYGGDRGGERSYGGGDRGYGGERGGDRGYGGESGGYSHGGREGGRSDRPPRDSSY